MTLGRRRQCQAQHSPGQTDSMPCQSSRRSVRYRRSTGIPSLKQTIHIRSSSRMIQPSWRGYYRLSCELLILIQRQTGGPFCLHQVSWMPSITPWQLRPSISAISRSFTRQVLGNDVAGKDRSDRSSLSFRFLNGKQTIKFGFNSLKVGSGTIVRRC